MAYSTHLQAWIDWLEGDHSRDALAAQLHDDVVFWSPVVHTPQRGKAVTLAYLTAAGGVLGGDSFKYVRIVDGGESAVLEFECEVDGIFVNGVDMIQWNSDGRIVDFKVMVRPLKAIQMVHGKMAEMLERLKAGA